MPPSVGELAEGVWKLLEGALEGIGDDGVAEAAFAAAAVGRGLSIRAFGGAAGFRGAGFRGGAGLLLFGGFDGFGAGLLGFFAAAFFSAFGAFTAFCGFAGFDGFAAFFAP